MFASMSGTGFHPAISANRDRVVSIPAPIMAEDWKEAIRLIHQGRINLDDHTATVETLDHYQQIWSNVDTREPLKVLINLSKDLEAL